MGCDSIFAALKEKFINVPVNLCTTGYLLEDTKLPYSYLSQLSNVLDWKDSQLKRYERSIYQFKVYAETFRKLNEILDNIETIYNWKTIGINPPRRLTLLEFLNRSEKSVIPQLYEGSVAYTIIIEKTLNTSKIQTLTTAENLDEALLKRYYQFPDLSLLIQPPVINEFTLETDKLPYFQISNLKTIIDHLTTKSRIESLDTSFVIYSETLEELVRILTSIEDDYDYGHFVLGNKLLMIFDWQSNAIEELQPQLWQGRINYNIQLEKYI